METLEEGSVEYKPIQSENLDGKTLDKGLVFSSLSESCVGSELVTEVQLSECYGGERVVVRNGDDNVELEGEGFERKLVDGHDNVDLKGVESEKKLVNVDGNDLEGVEMEQKLVDGHEGVESEKKFANVDDNNDLEGVEMEQKLEDVQGEFESEKKLEEVDCCNGLVGVDVENEFGDVDDSIDLEALGLANETDSPENLMEGDTLEHETQVLGSINLDTNKINGGDVLVAESGAEFNESQVNVVEKVGIADAVETIDTANSHDNDSPRKIEVSGDGISLFVEVFGPLNGIYQDGQVLGNGDSDCMLSMKNDSPNDAEGDAGKNQEHNFAVGDLVWVKIKTPLWWPGMICDPSATKDAGKCDQRDHLFVKYFGNTNSAWCQSFQLKPFLEYFEQMASQNKSRSFYGAIEKALGEIGKRVKQKMTCSCLLKENQIAAQSFLSKDIKDGHSVFLASQFDPASFLKSIRLRALDLHSPGSIELTVNESCLSAFYYSIGHKQLPLYKLRPTNNAKDEDLDNLSSADSVRKSCKSDFDDFRTTEVKMSGSLESSKGRMISHSEAVNENAGGKSEKGFESRERKKSKYLSYPYVNSWGRRNSVGQGGDEAEDYEEVSLGGVKSPSSPSMVSTPIGNCNNKNSQRKSRKAVTAKNDIGHNAEIISASSAEMLQELRLAALDCFFPSQSTSSIPIQEFYLSYRIFTNPVEVQMDEYKEAALGCQETYESSLGSNTSDNCLASGVYNLQGQEHPRPCVLPKKRGRKKREDRTSIDDSALVDTLENGTVNRKKKKVATAAVVHNEIGVLGGLPDLNGNNAGLSVENMQVIGPAPTQGKLQPKRKKRNKEGLVSEISMPGVSQSDTQFIPLPNSVQVTGLCSLDGSPQPNNLLGVQGALSLSHAELLAGQPNDNESSGTTSSLPDNLQIMDQLSSAKAEDMKRIRKEKASIVQNNSSALPDLNGHVSEPNLKGKDSAELSAVTGKPKHKRKRTTKSAIGIPAAAAGNTLLLDFRSGSSVPSKDYITGTFSRFGPLEESKTQFLNNSTAQVVFVKDSDAIEALQSLQSRNPFGPSLASYRIQHVSTSNNMQASHSFLPTDVLSGAVASNGEGPDLVVIKQNLEAMTTMLEKAGDNISSEMRAKLESEVKGFLKKVSSMVGSSS